MDESRGKFEGPSVAPELDSWRLHHSSYARYRQIGQHPLHRGQKPPIFRCNGKQQLVVLPAAQGGVEGRASVAVEPVTRVRINRKIIRLDDDADPGCASELADAVGQSVAEIDAGSSRSRPSEQRAQSQPWFGSQMSQLTLGSAFGCAVHQRRSERRKTGRRRAQSSTDVQLVAGPCARTREHATGFHRADRGEIDDERTWRAGDISANQRDPDFRGQAPATRPATRRNRRPARRRGAPVKGAPHVVWRPWPPDRSS